MACFAEKRCAPVVSRLAECAHWRASAQFDAYLWLFVGMQLLARRMEAAKQVEKQPEVLEGLQLLYRRCARSDQLVLAAWAGQVVCSDPALALDTSQ